MSHFLSTILRTRGNDYYHGKREWSRLLRDQRKGRAPLKSLHRCAWEWNVVGIGVAQKMSGGLPTGQPCIRFLVRHKAPPSKLGSKRRRNSLWLPDEIFGLTTDVQQVGRIRLAQNGHPDPKSTIRPVAPGCSVGFQFAGSSSNAGTLGAIVRNAVSGTRFFLSNAHVLGDVRNQTTPCEVTQPGTHDNPAATVIGQLDLPTAVFPQFGATNHVDAALARIDPGLAAPLSDIIQVGSILGRKRAADDMVVEKFGRSTEYRTGVVESITDDVYVPQPGGREFYFDNQISIKGRHGMAFAGEGDSGSLVLESHTNKAVGLFFAIADNGLAFANHIDEVLGELEVDFA